MALASALIAALAACSMSEPPPPAGPIPDASPAASPAPALLTWPEFLARPRPAPDHVIRYGDHERQVVDLYLPQGPGPHPVVVMIHGGCWSAPWDRTLMNLASDDLRKRGIAVWNIDYRVIENGNGYPHIFDDTFAAIHALTINGHQYRLDAQRAVAVGHSAGGHLALWYASKRRRWAPPPNVRMIPPPELRAVVSLGGLPDLELAERPPGSGCGTEVIGQVIGRGRAGRTDPFADTSVPRMGAIGIPQVLINGTQDRIIPTHFAEDYAGKMRAQGDNVRVRLIERTGHIELIAPGSAAWAATVEEIERALKLRSHSGESRNP
jgi:acetyl esterase/lipase